MKKECNVHLLDTENTTDKSLVLYLGKLGYGEYNPIHESGGAIRYYLYITSDKEIKEGDWGTDGKDVNQCTKNNIWNFKQAEVEKIIATTNPSLGLPLIPESFIKHYTSEYNKGNRIEKVNVEYEITYSGSGTYSTRVEDIVAAGLEPVCILKVDSNNYISILPVKDSWTREEVIEFAQSFAFQALGNVGISKLDRIYKYPNQEWIDENL